MLADGSDAAALIGSDGTVRGSITLDAIRGLAATQGESGASAT
jgi:hypothetical protein